MPTCTSDSVSDLPPSVKLVYKILEYNGELTQKQIVEVDYALTRGTSSPPSVIKSRHRSVSKSLSFLDY